MDPQLLELLQEGIAAGVCPIADDRDLRVLLAHLERWHAMTTPDTPPKPVPPPIVVPPTDAPRPTPPVVKSDRRRT